MGDMPTVNDNVDVSLIFGGMSPEHAASRESFSFVYDELSAKNSGVNIKNIYYVDMDNQVTCRRFDEALRAGDYMFPGDQTNYAVAAKAMLNDPGYIVNLLHGNYGEDGHLQGLAGLLKLRGTFGPVLPSSLAMSKIHMQRYVSGAQDVVKSPETLVIADFDGLSKTKILERFEGRKVVVKPNSLGASLFTECHTVSASGMSLIMDNLIEIFKYDERALVQEFVSGTEYSVGCVRLDNQIVVLPAVRIDTSRGFFGHEEKHRLGKVQEVVIENDTVEISKIKDVSRELFNELAFTHMCRFDYIVSNRGDIYFLEANPIPGLMKNSIFPKMLKRCGISIGELISNFSHQDESKAPKVSIYHYSID